MGHCIGNVKIFSGFLGYTEGRKIDSAPSGLGVESNINEHSDAYQQRKNHRAWCLNKYLVSSGWLFTQEYNIGVHFFPNGSVNQNNRKQEKKTILYPSLSWPFHSGGILLVASVDFHNTIKIEFSDGCSIILARKKVVFGSNTCKNKICQQCCINVTFVMYKKGGKWRRIV